MPKSKKLAMVMIVTLIFICTVGFTFIKIWEVKGPGGSLFKYSLFSKDSPQISSQESELRNLQWEKVKPGGALAVLRTKDNPENKIGITLKPLLVKDISELKNRVGDRFKVPSFTPEGYTFTEGQINASVSEDIRNTMLKEAENSTNDFVIKVIEPSENVGSYSIIYRNQDNEINVSLYFNHMWDELSQPDDGRSVDKISVNDFEAIYTFGNGRSEIKWINSSEKILYSIGCSESSAEKADLVKMAESLK